MRVAAFFFAAEVVARFPKGAAVLRDVAEAGDGGYPDMKAFSFAEVADFVLLVDELGWRKILDEDDAYNVNSALEQAVTILARAVAGK